jgi:hypothetical protein
MIEIAILLSILIGNRSRHDAYVVTFIPFRHGVILPPEGGACRNAKLIVMKSSSPKEFAARAGFTVLGLLMVVGFLSAVRGGLSLMFESPNRAESSDVTGIWHLETSSRFLELDPKMKASLSEGSGKEAVLIGTGTVTQTQQTVDIEVPTAKDPIKGRFRLVHGAGWDLLEPIGVTSPRLSEVWLRAGGTDTGE